MNLTIVASNRDRLSLDTPSGRLFIRSIQWQNYSYCCLADQFAIGSVETMGIYARRYDDLEKNCAKAGELHPEGSLTFHLKYNHVQVKFIRPLIRIIR